MLDLLLLGLAFVILIGMSCTFALLWAAYRVFPNGIDWDWSAGFRSLMDEKPEKKSKEEEPERVDIHT